MIYDILRIHYKTLNLTTKWIYQYLNLKFELIFALSVCYQSQYYSEKSGEATRFIEAEIVYYHVSVKNFLAFNR